MIERTATAKNKRTRQRSTPFAGLPALPAPQHAVLLRWLKSHAHERAWQSLLDAAGKDGLDHADALLEHLLQAGALAVKEVLKAGQWRLERIVWRDLAALQKALGVSTAAEHSAQRDGVRAEWQALIAAHAWLQAAAHAAMKAPLAVQHQRLPLLQAVLEWKQAQRTGLRQDFALAARGHTKGISNAEWDWLDAHLSLEALGIGRFEPIVWLAGTLTLENPDADAILAVRPLGFVGLPCRQWAAPWRVRLAPQRYWLVENRASFERQSARLEEGVCLVWLPGRPTGAWMQAMAWLLAQAPAPAAISCDPDPAGLQIAMTAGQLWADAGLAWAPQHMALSQWQAGPTRPLNDYDRRVLIELQADPHLPAPLAQLRDDMWASGCKAEQEGWL